MIAVVDQTAGYAIRYPATWEWLDGDSGQMITLAGGDGAALVLDSGDSTITDEDAAQAWVLELRPQAEILDVQPVEHLAGAGYAVAYQFSDADGESQSALAMLLNGEGERHFSANLRLAADVNLLAESARSDYAEFWSMMDTFMVLPELVIE